jgi:hypothetical protein
MYRASFWLIVFSLMVSQTAAANQPRSPEGFRNIILIGWDGAQRNHVQECLGRGELPNLEKLGSEGALVAIDVLRVTDTKSGWAQILTGYRPEITGVFSNSLYQPIPRGYTVFERLESFFGASEFVTAAVMGKKGKVGAKPPQRKLVQKARKKKPGKKKKRPLGTIVIENGIKYRLAPGQPYYYTQESMDVFVNGLREDQKVGTTTLDLLDRYRDRPFFFFVHFAEVDHMGHKHGENSTEYNDALISADHWTGKIIEKLRELGLYDQTLIYVTADHGFDEGMKSHRDAPYIFLATNDPQVRRRGDRADIAATILDRFGLDTSKIEPPLNGHSLIKPRQGSIW